MDNSENTQQSTVTARSWPSSNNQLVFPEDELNLKKTGICMSGGGTRAMVCAVGQFRGLVQLGLLKDVGYLSCVSGGSWASVPFTYYTAGAANDDELLGTIIPPEKLTIDGMKTVAPGFLAGAANAPLLDNMLNDIGSSPADQLWIRGVGKSYMKNYGLFDDGAPKYFSYDTSTVDEICLRNPDFRSEDFITVRNGTNDVHRPYLVVNSSLSGLYKNAPFINPEPLSVFNYTPLGIGSAVSLNPTFHSQSGSLRTGEIGGGFIEPFAFGVGAPTQSPTKCSKFDPGINCMKLDRPSTPFTIVDASGTSSSAFVSRFTSTKWFGHELRDLSPQEEYWRIPKIDGPLPTSEKYMFGDGGNLENLGAISLIQRNVNKLVVFVNTNTKLNEKYDIINFPTPTASDVSSDILTLFGVIGEGSQDMGNNKVFPESDLNNMMAQLVTAKRNGHSIIAQTSHTTIQNDWWGIPAGRTVEITWVYNDNVDDYLNQLEWEIKSQIKDFDGFPDFKNFPNYNTIMEDTGRLVELSPEQINLLYQFSAWNVYSNPDKFEILK